jgi:hypothetical protein
MKLRDAQEKTVWSPFWSTLKWALLVLVLLSGVGIVGSWLGLFARAVSTPAQVAARVIHPDNVLYNYEWFYDVNAQYEARAAQLRAWNGEYVAETDAAERRRLRVEVQAVSQSCRNLVTSYNANSEKLNRELFKGWSLPERLDLLSCEVAS